MMNKQRISCFKAYDIRGRVPDELDEQLAHQIGLAYAKVVGAQRVVVGHDIRLSSPKLAHALADGLRDGGVDVVWIGTCGTEMVYFATFHLKLDGGIMVTASHNPKDYNGMKFVREEAKPISGDTGLNDIEEAIVAGELPTAERRGAFEEHDIMDEYVDHLLGYVDVSAISPLKVVVNAGNGGAGAVIDKLEEHLPVEFVKIHHQPDGTFPNGVPNPLLPENRTATSTAVEQSGAALGLAWDGDFDRCFFFDERGGFVEGYYIVGLLATRALVGHPGAKVIHDPRLTWNTIDLVKQAGGVPVQSKTGHAFIKERMRTEDAIYGGEMSAHHYFKQFSYCDSGMIPWLLVLQELSERRTNLSSLIEQRQKAFPASGEINRRLEDPDAAITKVRTTYDPEALDIDETDGVSIELKTWRFNLRKSNTEPVVRLNVESKGDEPLMKKKTEEILALLDS